MSVWSSFTGSSPTFSAPGATSLTIFDDLISGAHDSGNGYPAGSIFRGSGNAGGFISGGNAGSDLPGVAGRVGLLGLGTGTTNNSTGQGFLDAQSLQVYCGMANITMQFGFKVPALATAGVVDYVIEMGFGTGYVSGGSALGTNGAAIVYMQSTSTNFQAITANNTTQTVQTTADSANFAVTANTWYNGKIVLSATAVNYYVAPAGGAYVLLATATTNLPSISQQCSPVFQIYKVTTATATSRLLTMDWVQFDITGLSR